MLSRTAKATKEPAMMHLLLAESNWVRSDKMPDLVALSLRHAIDPRQPHSVQQAPCRAPIQEGRATQKKGCGWF
jgi:hypothetical protein